MQKYIFQMKKKVMLRHSDADFVGVLLVWLVNKNSQIAPWHHLTKYNIRCIIKQIFSRKKSNIYRLLSSKWSVYKTVLKFTRRIKRRTIYIWKKTMYLIGAHKKK